MTRDFDENIWVSLSDLWLVCKKAKRNIIFWTTVGGTAAALYTLTRPVEYQSTATFREKSSGISTTATPSLTSMLLGSTRNSSYSEAISTMKSQALLGKVARNLNLQGTLVKKESRFPELSNIIKNLKVTYAHLRNVQKPIFPDLQPQLILDKVVYDGEVAIRMLVTFLSEDTYQIRFNKMEEPITGQIGIPLKYINAQFIIVRQDQSQPIALQEYELTIYPLPKVVENLLNKISIEIDRDDKTLLKLVVADANRHRAVAILNGLMLAYQKHLREEQRRITEEQIGYLKKRQDEMKIELRNMMEEHAAILSSDVLSLGFPDVNSAINFFAATQQKYTQDLLTIDLELKHLQEIKNVGAIQYAYDPSHNDSAGINATVARIRQLHQQSDSLELALGDVEGGIETSTEHLAEQMKELAYVQQLSRETSQIIASLEAGELPDGSSKLYHDNRYKVKSWCDNLQGLTNLREKETCRTHFLTYLSNLLHTFHVYEKAIHEGLTHQRNPQKEFQGIDLQTAKELYLTYSKKLNGLESDEAQNRFIIQQMHEPNFEISSLSSALTDAVSQDMISKTSALLLSLKDEVNRSIREQDRLRSEIAVKKGFLEEHLQQTIQLLQLNQKLLKEKISALQMATLGLIQQELSVLEKHLSDIIGMRIGQLNHQRQVIEQHQVELQQEMTKLPVKWVSEKLIDQQMELNGRMVEEITKLVESKNTQSSLDVIPSAPVDIAIASLLPKSPRLLFFIILGSALGALLSTSYAFVRTIGAGIPVTLENLTIAHQHVSGSLSKRYNSSTPLISDQDLETLRKLIVFLESSQDHDKGKIVALIVGQEGPDYSHHLATLLSKTGHKVLRLPLCFDKPAEQKDLPGLLQYLEGTAGQPKIVSTDSYSMIHPGGISRYAPELMRSSAFDKLLNEMKQQYDWIIVTSFAGIKNSEAQYLVQLSSYGVITIKDETWEDLKLIPKKHLSYIINQEN